MRKSYMSSGSSLDPSNISFSSASVAGSIQDDMDDHGSLTQAGLEEYNNRSFYDQPVLFHHQKQSSYAQSEGYHSYVSSSDSSSATPFLDRLRQESDLLSRQSHHWSQNDLTTSSPTGGTGHHHHHHHHHHSRSNSSSQLISDNNSSESTTSSTETLKWLGSMSDVSVASHATNSSAISGSVSSSSQLIVHSSRVRTPKRQSSESVLVYGLQDDHLNRISSNNEVTKTKTHSQVSAGQHLKQQYEQQQQQQQQYHHHQHSQQQYHHHHHENPLQQTTSIALSSSATTLSSSSATSAIGTSSSPSGHPQLVTTATTTTASPAPVTNGIQHVQILSSVSTAATSSPSTSTAATTICDSSNNISSNSYSSGVGILQSSAVTNSTVQSTPTSSSYRNNHRLFPVSTYVEPANGTASSNNIQSTGSSLQTQLMHQHHMQTQQQQTISGASGMKYASPSSHNWQSVAERISNFEHQQQYIGGNTQQYLQNAGYQQAHQQNPTAFPKYCYIEPSKTHRVSNPALKAFQKNAVQSYFERQQSNVNNRETLVAVKPSSNYTSFETPLRSQSLQIQASPKEVQISQSRSSLPNNFSLQQAHRNNGAQAQQRQHILNNSYIMSQAYEDMSFNLADSGAPPPPPPRSKSLMPVRRSSSASEYVDFREQFLQNKENRKSVDMHVAPVSTPEKSSFNDCGMPPPPPPPRGRVSMPLRRTSSASEYACLRELQQSKQNLSKDLLQPMIMGQIISVDDWVPERPPKNPHLRIPSPDLPPPPIQVVDTDLNLSDQDEPLPPPPPEILRHTIRQQSENLDPAAKPPSPTRRNSFAGSPSRKQIFRSSGFENITPPSVPKKASAVEMLQSRPVSSLAHQSHKAHKVILNGRLESPMAINNNLSNGSILSSSQHEQSPRIAARKRAHNPLPTPVTSAEQRPQLAPKFNLKSPPPLKPRTSIQATPPSSSGGQQEIRSPSQSSVPISEKLR